MPLLWSSKKPCDDLQTYIAEAMLPSMPLGAQTPPMPPPGHKSHRNWLHTRPERLRRLTTMHALKETFLNDDVVSFCKQYVPEKVEETESASGSKLLTPCKGFNVEDSPIIPLRNLGELSTRWVSQYAADTVQRIIELMPIYRALEESWTFTLSEDFTERDYGLLRYFIWNKLNSIGVPEKSSLILVHQPPWILSPEDIRQFTLTKSLRMLNRMALNDDKGRYTSSERLWAKMWDMCTKQKCRFFVLTNYYQWVFGCFSEGWTSGFCTVVHSTENRDPSLLETLLFWVVSSMQLPDTSSFVIPKFPEVVSNLVAEPPRSAGSSVGSSSGIRSPSYMDDMAHLSEVERSQRFRRMFDNPPVPSSPSIWAGQSEDAGSSAGHEHDELAINSPKCTQEVMQRSSRHVAGWLSGQNRTSMQPFALDFDPPIILRASMQEQLAMPMLPPPGFVAPFGPPIQFPLPPIAEPPSPAMSTWSARSTATIRQGGMKNGVISSVVPEELRVEH